MRLEKEFRRLSVTGRVRLGYGTNQLLPAPGVEAKRIRIGVHVNEIMEALENAAPSEDAGLRAEYGPLQRITGLTGRMRTVRLLVQADRLPMTLVDVDADVEAPLAAGPTR